MGQVWSCTLLFSLCLSLAYLDVIVNGGGKSLNTGVGPDVQGLKEQMLSLCIST